MIAAGQTGVGERALRAVTPPPRAAEQRVDVRERRGRRPRVGVGTSVDVADAPRPVWLARVTPPPPRGPPLSAGSGRDRANQLRAQSCERTVGPGPPLPLPRPVP